MDHFKLKIIPATANQRVLVQVQEGERKVKGQLHESVTGFFACCGVGRLVSLQDPYCIHSLRSLFDIERHGVGLVDIEIS